MRFFATTSRCPKSCATRPGTGACFPLIWSWPRSIRNSARGRTSWDIDKTFRERFGRDVCETRIAESVSLAESPFAEKDVFEHAPDSRGARDYQALYEELKAVDFLAMAA